MRKQENQEALDRLIERVIDDMEMFGPTSEEYEALLARYERLTKLKAEDRPKPVSRDTMLIVAGNLAGIIIVVMYEHAHVLTSKALGTVWKPRTE